jgi:hypothetical protein
MCLLRVVLHHDEETKRHLIAGQEISDVCYLENQERSGEKMAGANVKMILVLQGAWKH